MSVLQLCLQLREQWLEVSGFLLTTDSVNGKTSKSIPTCQPGKASTVGTWQMLVIRSADQASALAQTMLRASQGVGMGIYPVKCIF